MYPIQYKELIKSYCLSYNVYPVDTTIEGALINKQNVKIFKDWLITKDSYIRENVENLYNISSNLDDVTSAFRLAVNGKYDTLKQIMNEQITNQFPDNIRKGYFLIRKLRKKFNKTSGWVTNWLDFVFYNYINISESREARVNWFNFYFPELYDIIKNIENK